MITFKPIDYQTVLFGVCCSLWFIPSSICAQQTMEDGEWMEQIMNRMDDTPEEQVRLYLEHLQNARQHPLNINAVSVEEVLALGILDETKVMALFQYQARHGKLLSMSELQAISALTFDDRRLLSSVFYVGDNSPIQPSKDGLAQCLKQPHLNTMLSAQVPLDEPLQSASYYGNNLSSTLRLKFNSGSAKGCQLQAAITGDKDAGESFTWNNTQMGYDHYSYYVSLKNWGALKQMVVGDYRLNWGQGLVVNNNFSFGQNALFYDVVAPQGIRPYASSSEGNYFEGIAATFQWRRWQTTAFVSRRLFDARINSNYHVSSLRFDGYHRTPLEVRQHNVQEVYTAGMHLEHSFKRWHVGTTTLFTHYGVEMEPANTLANRYAFKGTQCGNVSVDYAYRTYPFSFSGETAVSHNGTFAFLHQFIFRFGNRHTISVQHRYYDKAFHSPYAQAAGDASTVRNEHGLYLQHHYQPSQHFNLRTALDVFHHPWAQYRASAPSHGMEFSTRCAYVFNRINTLSGSYRFKSKQLNYKGLDGKDALQLAYCFQHTVNILLKTEWSKVYQSSTALDVRLYQSHGEPMEKGFQLSHRINWKPVFTPLQLSARVDYYHTDGYNSRLTAYQPSPLYCYAFSVHYGEGVQTSLLATYKWSKRMVAELKYGINHPFIKDGSRQKQTIILQLRSTL